MEFPEKCVYGPPIRDKIKNIWDTEIRKLFDTLKNTHPLVGPTSAWLRKRVKEQEIMDGEMVPCATPFGTPFYSENDLWQANRPLCIIVGMQQAAIHMEHLARSDDPLLVEMTRKGFITKHDVLKETTAHLIHALKF